MGSRVEEQLETEAWGGKRGEERRREEVEGKKLLTAVWYSMVYLGLPLYGDSTVRYACISFLVSYRSRG